VGALNIDTGYFTTDAAGIQPVVPGTAIIILALTPFPFLEKRVKEFKFPLLPKA
jgi:hypothetical protein